MAEAIETAETVKTISLRLSTNTPNWNIWNTQFEDSLYQQATKKRWDSFHGELNWGLPAGVRYRCVLQLSPPSISYTEATSKLLQRSTQKGAILLSHLLLWCQQVPPTEVVTTQMRLTHIIHGTGIDLHDIHLGIGMDWSTICQYING